MAEINLTLPGVSNSTQVLAYTGIILTSPFQLPADSGENPTESKRISLCLLRDFSFNRPAEIQIGYTFDTWLSLGFYRMAAAPSSSPQSNGAATVPLPSSSAVHDGAPSASSAIDFLSICHRLKVLLYKWFFDWSL